MKAHYFFRFLLCLLPVSTFCQAVDHWEAAVLAEDEWRYRLGNTEPPSNWNQADFNDTDWALDPGGFGYGDGDDNTLIPPTNSLYIRRTFTIFDIDAISAFALHADYDDAFVAYLNGVEIARANIGTVGDPPAHDDTALDFHEAQLYQGGLPEVFSVSLEELENLWQNGNNTLAIQIHNAGINSSDFSALFYLIFGINDSSSNYRPVPEWFQTPLESSNLPLLFINTAGANIPDEPKIDAHLGIIDNGPGNLNFLTDNFNGYDGNIGIELRGSSSLSFPKKSYGIETRLPDGENNNVSLLGMPAENDWILYGPYSDKSLMRNVLSFHIGHVMDRYVPRTRWCEIFINNEYRGVYVLMEKIKRDENRVDIANLRPEDIAGDELTGGYIFQIDRADQGPESGWYSPFTDDVFYRYKDPDFDELVPAQKEYLRNYVTAFEASFNGGSGSDSFEDYIDIPSWIDFWIATEIFKHIDNYRLSFYMYKKKDSNGGKIHFGPLWDINLGYGNFDYAEDPAPEGWSYIWANQGFLRPFWILNLSEDPAIQDQAHCRWNELREGSLHTDSLLQFIDNNAEFLADAQARNFARWSILGQYVWPNSFVGDTYEEEVNFLKTWLTSRLEWMDENMLGECAVVSTNEVIESSHRLQVSPNPFEDKVSFLLESPSLGNRQLTLFDARGRVIIRASLEPGLRRTFDLSPLAGGLYFYQLAAADQIVASGKLVKE